MSPKQALLGKSRARDVSKFVSLVLRHDPSAARVTLDENGWCDFEQLSAELRRRFKVSDEEILHVIDSNDKQRFVLRDGRIRANQGHSVDIELALDPVEPPDTLLHGTQASIRDALAREGLTRQSRRFVHLSADRETARIVARRRAGPHLLVTVAAGAMHRDGHVFHISENGVWLTEAVPPRYLGFEPLD